jgi:hypothetical protein
MRRLFFVMSLILCLCGQSLTTETQHWPDEQTLGPFQYRADFSLARHSALLQDVARLRFQIPATLQIDDSLGPVHLHLFKKKSTYQRYLRAYFPGVPMRRALYIQQDGVGMVFVYLNRELAVDLRHETTHAVLHGLLPMVPLWLDEGLAEYFEAPEANRLQRHPHFKAVLDGIHKHRIPPIEKLESIDDMADMEPADYQDSWAWVHFFLHGPDAARRLLNAYLRDIQRHVPPGRFSERAVRAIPDLEQQFAAHFLRMERLAANP